MTTPDAINDLGRTLLELAPQHGFPIAGVLDLAMALPSLSTHVRRYGGWLADARHGDMSYLDRGATARTDPRLWYPEARGVLCVAMPYGPGDDRATPPSEARYAAYLRGRDYHRVLPERLEALLAAARTRYDFEWRIACDTSPVLERSWAALAGLGWIGKNTCLIHPRLGSYLFLAEAFLNVSPGGTPIPMEDRCGRCTRCLTACPTRAFPTPSVLDATRCLSYWTLEKRRDLDLTDVDVSAVGPRVAGCDVCQEVCPFNVKPRPELAEDWSDPQADATTLTEWEALMEEDAAAYRRRTRSSALSWVRPAHFRRNVAFALASVAEQLDETERIRLIPAVERAIALADTEGDALAVVWRRCLRALTDDQSPK